MLTNPETRATVADVDAELLDLAREVDLGLATLKADYDTAKAARREKYHRRRKILERLLDALKAEAEAELSIVSKAIREAAEAAEEAPKTKGREHGET